MTTVQHYVDHYLGPQFGAAVRLRNLALLLLVLVLLIGVCALAAGMVCSALVHLGLDIQLALLVFQVLLVAGSITIVFVLPRKKIGSEQYFAHLVTRAPPPSKDSHISRPATPPTKPPRHISCYQ